jgi:mannose-P-dolichol utilization defect protein 1
MAFSISKHFPFSTYGETVFISLQNVILVLLVLGYTGRLKAALPLLAGYTTWIWWSIQIASSSTLEVLQGLTIPLLIASRVPQIYTNFAARSTGQLALLTWALNFLGSIGKFLILLMVLFTHYCSTNLYYTSRGL